MALEKAKEQITKVYDRRGNKEKTKNCDIREEKKSYAPIKYKTGQHEGPIIRSLYRR